MADIGWRRGSSPAARTGARQRAGLTPASASNTLSCQRETLHSQQLRSITKSIDSDHGIFRGETLVLNDMIGGHVDVFFGNIAAGGPPFRDGRVKILAIADTRRSPVLPEIPTTAEAGLPGLVSTGWFALAAPPKTAPALTAEIAKAAVDVIKAPDVQARFRTASVEPIGNSPAEMAAFIQAEAQRWGEVIKKNNIVVD